MLKSHTCPLHGFFCCLPLLSLGKKQRSTRGTLFITTRRVPSYREQPEKLGARSSRFVVPTLFRHGSPYRFTRDFATSPLPDLSGYNGQKQDDFLKMPRTDQSRTRGHGTQTVQEDRRREKEVEPLYTRARLSACSYTLRTGIYTGTEGGISRARTHTRTSGDAILRVLCRVDPSLLLSSDLTRDDPRSTRFYARH